MSLGSDLRLERFSPAAERVIGALRTAWALA
jgi:hypothetical protein